MYQLIGESASVSTRVPRCPATAIAPSLGGTAAYVMSSNIGRRSYASRMSKQARETTNPRCSFCGKPRDQVKKLVAGPGVYICNECISLCNEILEEDARPRTPGTGAVRHATAPGPPRRSPNLLGWLRNLLPSRTYQRA